eukprot:17650-Heterococcus_DN1.PRE.2
MKREHDANSHDEKQGAKKACSSSATSNILTPDVSLLAGAVPAQGADADGSTDEFIIAQKTCAPAPALATVPEAVHLAAAIGRITHRPAMVVVDLDYTLFPCYAHEQTCGPYARGGLDEVLCINKRLRAQGSFALFPGVRASLQAISMQNIRLALASRSPHPLAGRSLLQTLELLHLFEQTHMIARAKDHHFRLIHEASGIDFQVGQTANALSDVKNVQRGHTR